MDGLQQVNWMDASVKDVARKKVRKMEHKIGYPRKVSTLKI